MPGDVYIRGAVAQLTSGKNVIVHAVNIVSNGSSLRFDQGLDQNGTETGGFSVYVNSSAGASVKNPTASAIESIYGVL